jgi:hypothetical protein
LISKVSFLSAVVFSTGHPWEGGGPEANNLIVSIPVLFITHELCQNVNPPPLQPHPTHHPPHCQGSLYEKKLIIRRSSMVESLERVRILWSWWQMGKNVIMLLVVDMVI